MFVENISQKPNKNFLTLYVFCFRIKNARKKIQTDTSEEKIRQSFA